MSESVRPPNAPTWTDLVLLAMGVSLLSGLVVGWVSAVPVRVGGSAGSVLAAATLLVGIWWRPSARPDRD